MELMQRAHVGQVRVMEQLEDMEDSKHQRVGGGGLQCHDGMEWSAHGVG